MNPGSTFLEINDEFGDLIPVFAFDRDGKPAVATFDLTMICPRP